MADWNTTSTMGFDFEKITLQDISEKKYPLAFRNMKKEDYKYYDIVLFNGKFPIYIDEQIKVECKYDEMASITGNICIEVGCNTRASGLTDTKAKYWIICDGKTTYLIEKQRIHDCIVDNMDKIEYRKNCRVMQENGITKDMDIYLIKKSIFEPYCLEIADKDKMTYEKMI
jgi:hypothetical protein